ncbi:MAG: sigma-54-dependent Fis family transcriptional regulator [Betaproteobacteria bacterium]|uniref:Sigma-54-dependent Fis family transcriptional regulator n=1 Tax=Candidatus Proximibacter danicus TaxID=2954365 RepID=A0A9D7K0B1_9PROT|nr:sigma-54-dependent Fis family transcriptional regulator [Candidatus Proximibacter danicus]MBK9447461.1 sigma-54-dependent Fis family transcriptional regulator [Betaproteobacteria bacterium]
MKQGRILVVDDEEIARRNLSHVLEREGYEVDCAQDGASALALLAEKSYQLLLTDLRMPGIDGLELLRQTKSRWPETEVVMITAHANTSSAVEAMSNGAFYYVEKPFRLPDVRKIVGEATQKAALKRENASLKAALDQATTAPRIISSNPELLAMVGTADGIAGTDCNVLIVGEAGTGRQTLARHIHEKSGRHGNFVTVDCAAQAEDALISALFGTDGETGAIDEASNGTLFIDNIAAASAGLQLRLQRLLQDGEFSRVGSNQGLPAAIRVIGATDRDIAALAEAGQFRQDLFFRLAVVTLSLPPLRKRRGDIPLLAMHFLGRAAQRMGKGVSEISPEAFDRLLAHGFPGNLRELENIVERGVALATGNALTVDLLPEALANPGETPAGTISPIKTLEALEREHILKALEHTGGNRALAAQLLGIDRVSLWRKLRRYNEEM